MIRPLDVQGPKGSVGKVSIAERLDIATLAQIIREEAGALEIVLSDGLEYAFAQRIARRLQQER